MNSYTYEFISSLYDFIYEMIMISWNRNDFMGEFMVAGY